MATPQYSRYYTYIAPVIRHPFVRSVAPQIFNLVTLTIFILFAIRPTVSTITTLQQEIDNHQQVLNGLNSKIQNLATAKATLETMSPTTRQTINAAIPSQANVPTLVAQLQASLANQASISALQIAPTVLYDTAPSSTKSAQLREVKFSYNVTGSYPSLVQLLRSIGTISRTINIDNVMISKQASVGATLSVSGKAYFLR